MKYYSEELIKHWAPASWLHRMEEYDPSSVVNVCFCRNCEYWWAREGDTVGQCQRFDEPFFTNINAFCSDGDENE